MWWTKRFLGCDGSSCYERPDALADIDGVLHRGITSSGAYTAQCQSLRKRFVHPKIEGVISSDRLAHESGMAVDKSFGAGNQFGYFGDRRSAKGRS